MGDRFRPGSSQRFCLAGYVRMGVQDEVLYLGFGSIQTRITDRELWRPLVALAGFWESPHGLDDAHQFLSQEHDIAGELAERAIGILRDGGFLSPAESFSWSDRYSRHLLQYEMQGADPATVQAALASKHVVVIGCGGIGNLVATQLACSGVGHLTLVDDDHIELTNLTRQLMFTEQDVGLSKVAVLSERLAARNSTVTVDAIHSPVDSESALGSLPKGDLVVLSADTAGVVETTNRHCVAHGNAWINVGYVNDIAVWGPLVVPQMSGCWACQQLVAQPDRLAPDLGARCGRSMPGTDPRPTGR